ncbi:MAG TPA: PEP-CTERM sorting domain-containing protein [Phycisphaerae bacterium]|nr:PEP-CTERM sorting domain-containing protein [Phycisphaerae bacterium]
MKRVVLFALSVALFAGVANAQTNPGTAMLWIQPAGGGNQINLVESETAVIQLWMNYSSTGTGSLGAEKINIGMDGQLDHLDAAGINFEVVGFNSFGPWGVNGTFYTKSHGQLDEAPYDNIPDYTGVGNLDWYQYQGTVTPPYSNQTGLLPNDGNILLDEIIIHGVTDGGSLNNRVFFAGGLFRATWFEHYFYGGSQPDCFKELDFAFGTGANKTAPVYVHVTVPEPASLALLAFGGLAVIRRRR